MSTVVFQNPYCNSLSPGLISVTSTNSTVDITTSLNILRIWAAQALANQVDNDLTSRPLAFSFLLDYIFQWQDLVHTSDLFRKQPSSDNIQLTMPVKLFI